MDSKIFKEFVLEYQKVAEFITNPDYDNYLKEGLKKAITDRFSQYVVRDGLIQSIDGEVKDASIPFEAEDTSPF